MKESRPERSRQPAPETSPGPVRRRRRRNSGVVIIGGCVLVLSGGCERAPAPAPSASKKVEASSPEAKAGLDEQDRIAKENAAAERKTLGKAME